MSPNYQEYVELLFGGRKAVWRPETRHEAYLLLATIYRKSEAVRESVSDLILDGPPEELLPEERREERRTHQIFELLSFLKNQNLPLSSRAIEALKKIKSDHPKWEPFGWEGMSHWMQAGPVGKDPKRIDFAGVEPDGVVNAILSFEPQLDSSLRDIGEMIGVRIAQHPDWGLRALEAMSSQVQNLPSEVLNPILWGIRAPLSDQSARFTKESAGELLWVFAKLVERRPDPAQWFSLPSVMADLVSKMSLDPAVWDPIARRLESLFDGFDHDRKDERAQVDWLNRAINHPYGDLVEMYLKLAQSHIEQLTAANKPLTLEPRAEAFLKRMARQYQVGSRYGYCLVSQRLAWIEAVSPSYAQLMQGWFDWTKHEERALVTWSGYLWGRTLARAPIEHFESTYLETARRHRLFAKEERNGLASHLAAAFWFHPELAPHLNKTLSLVDSDVRLALVHDWKLHLQNARSEVAEKFFKEVVIPYWQWCGRQPFFSGSESDSERFAFYNLLPYSWAAFPQASRVAIALRPRQPKSLYIFLKDLIAQEMYKYPDELVDLLLVVVDFDPHPHLEQKQWLEVWQHLKKSQPRKLAALENELAKRSIVVS